MIRVTRTSEPSVLRRNGRRWLSELRDALSRSRQLEAETASKASIEQAKVQVAKIQQKYNHDEIKDALKKMFHGKCAYCESRFGHVTYGHIEHFYPKGKYADKTFEWSNLLLACPVCNDPKHKGTRFPSDRNGDPMLIDPTDGITEPARHLNFSWDNDLGLASIYGIDERGREVEHIFDLNRDDLLRERSEHVQKMILILRHALQGDSEAMALAKEACQPDAPYLAFALTYVSPYFE